MISEPLTIFGDNFEDYRGIISYVNDFDLRNVRRFYTTENKNTSIIRAWQGHQNETKYFFPLKGKFVLAWVRMDDFTNPSENLIPKFNILKSSSPAVQIIPPGFANGFRALVPNSLIGVFSDRTLAESMKDDYRYDHAMWFDWFQEFEKENKN